jgi:2-(1,2-epoxy-1,2-dihydrophenyl)acetyl-CoA isomerase
MAVLLEERQGSVALLRLNRPETLNALDRTLVDALGAALERVTADRDVRAVVLTGEGGAFCSGADLKAAMSEGMITSQDLDAVLDRYHGIIRGIVGAPKPVIAAVDGVAVGFGCDLALACDLRILSSTAMFQEKFVKIGLMPDGGGTFWLPRLVGLARAMEIMLGGEPIPADRALALGLANRVVAPADLRESALRWAHDLAKGPPLAFAEIKRAVRAGLGGTIDAALDMEKKGQIRCLTSQDCMEGVMAWMQKREPHFQGK